VHTRRRGFSHAWSSPEFLNQEQITPASDVFSLGVVLWELLTLREPWGGLAMGLVFASICSKSLEVPVEVEPALRPLRDVIPLCLQMLPKQRPSASEVVRALRAATYDERSEDR
jgi:serine/threonine protein kinase